MNAPTEIDTSAAATIAEIAAEFESAQPELESVSQGEQTPVAAAPTGQDTSPAPEVKSDPVVSPSDISAAVSRELALKSREDALTAREQYVSQIENELKSYKEKALPDDFVQFVGHSPSQALKALGYDPDNIVRMILAEKLSAEGKQVPAELQNYLGKIQQDRKISQLEARLAEQNRIAQSQAFVLQVETGAREWLSKTDFKDMPTLGRAIKANPARVYGELMQEIATDANQKARTSPNAPLITYEEAAKRIEARYSEFSKFLSPESSSPVTNNPGVNPGNASMTPGSKQVTTGGTPNPSIKPPAKPLAPWLRRTDLEVEGINAGIAEYKRLQNK